MAATSRSLIQVVAQLLPMQCGVSDYAISLAQELQSEFDIGTVFAIVNSTGTSDVRFPRAYCAQTQLLETCISLSQGQPGALLVHLSGYGFSRDGAPAVLAESLAKVRQSGQFQIGVYFHELYAGGRFPWRSAFWHVPRQKRAVRGIARDCDLLVTSTQGYAGWLERETKPHLGSSIKTFPVFSNVGEAQELVPVDKRRPTIVVFGKADTRKRAFEQLSSHARMVKELGVEQILDIGPECDVPPEIAGIPTRKMGVLPVEHLGNLLSNSKFGFVHHAPEGLAKSSVFAGFCAHGTVPVIARPFAGEFDGLKDGVHLISPNTAHPAEAAELDRYSNAVWRWYSGHSLRAHARMFAQWLHQASIEG